MDRHPLSHPAPPTAPESATPERHAAARKSTLVSVLVNVVLATAQIVVGFFSHSQSLISDGLHSLTDLIADFVVLVANKLSRQSADAEHPYGHARVETVASLMLGTLLIVAGMGMLWLAAEKFLEPHKIVRVHTIALFVALLTLVCKEMLFQYMLRVAHKVNSTMLVANAWHARADAVSSLVVATGIIGNLLGYTFFDPLAAGVVGLLICRTGAKFAWKALSHLMDSGLSPLETAQIRQTLANTPGVKNVHDLRTRYMGDDVLIDVHLIVDPRLSASEAHQIGNAARARAREIHHVIDVLVHIDTENDAEENAPLPLPSRETILEWLPEAVLNLKPELTLYYQREGLDVDILLPRPLNESEKENVAAAVAHLCARSPSLKNVRVMNEIGCGKLSL